MLRAFVEWINEVTAPLYLVIYGNEIFFFDYWSIVHFISGAGLYEVLTFLRVRRLWWTLFALLFLYELLEITAIFVALDLFRPETLKDQITDILVGGIGAATAKVATASLMSLGFRAGIFTVSRGKGPFLPPPCSHRCAERRFFS